MRQSSSLKCGHLQTVQKLLSDHRAGLSTEAVRAMVDVASKTHSTPDDAAWALRNALDAVYSTAAMGTMGGYGGSGRSMTTLLRAASRWRAVDDVVMGGRSR